MDNDFNRTTGDTECSNEENNRSGTAAQTEQSFSGGEYHYGVNAQPLPTDNNDERTQQPSAERHSYSPSMNKPEPASYSPYSAKCDGKPKKKKKRNSNLYSHTMLIACCIACALLASLLTSAAMISGLSAIQSTSASDNNSAKTTTVSGGSSNTVIQKSEENIVSAIAQKVVPSVVGIKATVDYGYWGQGTESEGSGVIYTEDGYIITNYHVISDAVKFSSAYTTKILVYLTTDSENAIECTVSGYDSVSDIAVLKIDKTGLTKIDIADSDKLQVGETAVAIGNPGGLEYMGSVSSGIISGLNRHVSSELGYIQTDAAINPGNSGGALVNAEGKLIGINTSKISATEYEGMGFSLPSNYVVNVVENIIQNKNSKYAYLGISVNTYYTGTILQFMGYPSGVVVENVAEGSPAATARIKENDIITEFDGVAISSYDEFNEQRLNHKPGEKITLKIYRNGSYADYEITLGEANS